MNITPDSTKRILHVVAGSGQGGAETYCLDMIKALHEAGIRQHVICRPHAHYLEAFRQRGIPFDTLSFSVFEKFIRGPALIRKTVAAFRPDLVHAWMGRAASFIPRNISVPVLGWFGGYYDLKRYRACDFFMGVTRDIVRHIGDKCGHPEQVFLVHTFGTLEDAPPVDRRALSTPNSAPVVLLLSRMHWKKGVDTLLHAAAKLPGVYFWLAGDGPDIEKYKRLSTRLNLDDRVRFLGWRHDRAALLKSANVCVLPSRYEPFGTVIAESWYARTPLVAARAAGARQYVTHMKDGLLCEIDDTDGLAQQIHAVLSSDDLVGKLVTGGTETYESLFSKNVVVKSMLDAYGKIIGEGKDGFSLPKQRNIS